MSKFVLKMVKKEKWIHIFLRNAHRLDNRVCTESTFSLKDSKLFVSKKKAGKFIIEHKLVNWIVVNCKDLEGVI